MPDTPAASASVPSDTRPADLAIIGAGPVGLFAAFYAGLRQMSVMLIDSLDVLGGQLITLYPEKYVYDVAGFPKVLAKELAYNLIEQGTQYGPQVCLGEQVTDLDFHDATKTYTVRTDRGAHEARAVLIAAGVGSFQAKTLPLPGVDRFAGHGLHYFVKEVAPFAGRRILIVGGGDSAVDWANALAPAASQLTIIHRRDQFRAHEDSVAKMRRTPAVIKTPYELKSIDGNGKVERATIYHNQSKHEETLDVDHVLVNVGFNNSLGPITAGVWRSKAGP
jgi:thioredoxin reductase (NADPH)